MGAFSLSPAPGKAESLTLTSLEMPQAGKDEVEKRHSYFSQGDIEQRKKTAVGTQNKESHRRHQRCRPWGLGLFLQAEALGTWELGTEELEGGEVLLVGIEGWSPREEERGRVMRRVDSKGGEVTMPRIYRENVTPHKALSPPCRSEDIIKAGLIYNGSGKWQST